MSLDNHFHKVRHYYPGILTNVRHVLSSGKCTSPKHTMTLSQIRAGYRELTNERFPNMGDPRLELCFLLSAPYIACFANKHGTFHFYIVPHADN
ncbi:uncharacterized protein Dmoj_GI18049 [Drosophila mojavensis]|uniref:Uncharacterized protein n=1 Tax=Drosophila mojavensis TaxID=7230 RepID=B4KFL4_DROMO|nr:uncharacterized protein Dmoj_GI18049 [Drosophila mojavensis]